MTAPLLPPPPVMPRLRPRPQSWRATLAWIDGLGRRVLVERLCQAAATRLVGKGLPS